MRRFETLYENYTRVLPRDLFNESMLLKSMGRLSLLILDRQAPKGLEMTDVVGEEGFQVDMNENGELEVGNVQVSVNGTVRRFFTPVNSRENYPLNVVGDDYEEVEVFDRSGGLTEEFVEFCSR